MYVLVLGGKGFIGSASASALAAAGDKVVVTTRREVPDYGGTATARRKKEPAVREKRNTGETKPAAGTPDSGGRNPEGEPGGVTCVQWDGFSAQSLCPLLEGVDAVVSLAGANIGDGLWTEQRRRVIVQSRVDVGNALSHACGMLKKQGRPLPAVLVQASATGYYGGWDDLEKAPLCLENRTPGQGFLATTVVNWEKSTEELARLGVRRCILRFAPVLGPGGGMLHRIAPMFRNYLGGPLGDGRRPFSWVHLDDAVAAIQHFLRGTGEGAYTVAAPDVRTMGQFARMLAEAVRRPAWFHVPAFFLRLLPGNMGPEIFLTGQNVSCERLLQSGFTFRHPELAEALRASV